MDREEGKKHIKNSYDPSPLSPASDLLSLNAARMRKEKGQSQGARELRRSSSSSENDVGSLYVQRRCAAFFV